MRKDGTPMCHLFFVAAAFSRRQQYIAAIIRKFISLVFSMIYFDHGVGFMCVRQSKLEISNSLFFFLNRKKYP